MKFSPVETSRKIKEIALRHGFQFCGLSEAGYLEEEAPRLEAWLNQSLQGQMAYMENHFDKRLDPRLLVEGAKSVVSLLLNYYQIFGKAPELFCMGFAAYLQFMHSVKEENGKYFGDSNGELYPIQCDYAGYFHEAWKDFSLTKVLADKTLWGEDLSALPGFEAAVTKYL